MSEQMDEDMTSDSGEGVFTPDTDEIEMNSRNESWRGMMTTCSIRVYLLTGRIRNCESFPDRFRATSHCSPREVYAVEAGWAVLRS